MEIILWFTFHVGATAAIITYIVHSDNKSVGGGKGLK